MALFDIVTWYFPPALVLQMIILLVFIRRDNKSDFFRTSNYQHCMWYFRKIIPFQILLFCFGFFFLNRELESRACPSNRTRKLFGEQNCQAGSSSRNNFPCMERKPSLSPYVKLEIASSIVIYSLNEMKISFFGYFFSFITTAARLWFFVVFGGLFLSFLSSGRGRNDKWRKNSSNVCFLLHLYPIKVNWTARTLTITSQTTIPGILVSCLSQVWRWCCLLLKSSSQWH